MPNLRRPAPSFLTDLSSAAWAAVRASRIGRNHVIQLSRDPAEELRVVLTWTDVATGNILQHAATLPHRITPHGLACWVRIRLDQAEHARKVGHVSDASPDARVNLRAQSGRAAGRLKAIDSAESEAMAD